MKDSKILKFLIPILLSAVFVAIALFFDKNMEDVTLNLMKSRLIDSDRKILFVHFPKTGGSNILGQICKDYPCYSNSIMNKDEKLDHVSFIDTHTPRFNLSQQRLINAKKITFFRDPKERVMSEYRASKDGPNRALYHYTNNITFLEYLKQNDSLWSMLGHLKNNIYVRNLVEKPWGNYKITENDVNEAIRFLEEFEFIGFMDDYDKDFRDLCDFLYIRRPFRVPRRNVTKTKEKVYVTPEIERELDRLTKYDYMVYEAAKKVAARKRKECKKYGNGICRMRIES